MSSSSFLYILYNLFINLLIVIITIYILIFIIKKIGFDDVVDYSPEPNHIKQLPIKEPMMSLMSLPNTEITNEPLYFGIRKNESDHINKQAAKYLADVYNKVNIVVNYAYEHHLPNKIVADRLYNRWASCKLKETSSNDDSVAFTINKGRELRICIRNGPDSFEDPNTTIFVILHELAHIMSFTYGHNEEFMDNFRYICELATKLGVYKPQNFYKEPKNYCGHVISTTPLVVH